MGDSVPKHTGPISLTDTHLEPSVSRTDRPPPERIAGDGKGLLPETLKRLADAIVWRRNLLLSSTSVLAAVVRLDRKTHCKPTAGAWCGNGAVSAAAPPAWPLESDRSQESGAVTSRRDACGSRSADPG